MAPPLVDRYKRYKAGTTKVLTWLVEQSATCQNVSGLFNIRPGESAFATVVTIKTKDISILASIVAQAADIRAPVTIVRTIKEVISLRKECATWYAETNSSSKENRTHTYFIGVLESVLRKLERSVAPNARPPVNTLKSVDQSISGPALMQNVFEALEVEEPSQWTERLHEPRAQPMPLPIETRFELEDHSNEAALAVYCFLKEFNDLRSWVHEKWLDYIQHETDLATFAFATNSASGLILESHSTLLQDFPELTSWESIVKLVALEEDKDAQDTEAALGASVVELERFTSTVPEDLVSEVRGGQQRDMLCKRARTLLHQRHSMTCKSGASKSGAKDVAFQIDSNEPCQKAFDLLTEMLELVLDHSGTTICGDALLLHLSTAAERCSRYESPALVFSAQIFLDLNHLFAENKFQPLNDLRRLGAHAIERVGAYAQCIEGLNNNERRHVGNLLKQTSEEGALGLLKGLIEFIELWVLPERLQGTCTDDTHELSLSNHPILCGLMADTIARRMHEYGLHVCNVGRLVIPAAHLYNAAVGTGMMGATWERMNNLIDAQGEDRIFIGTCPASPEQARAHMALAMGEPLSSFATDTATARTSKPWLKAFKPVRTLITKSIITQHMSQLWQQGKIRWSGENVMHYAKEIVNACLKDSTAAQAYYADNMNNASDSSHSARRAQVLYLTLQEERSQLHFDYFTVAQECIQFVLQLTARLEHIGDMVPVLGHPYIDFVIPISVEYVAHKKPESKAMVETLQAAIEEASMAADELQAKYTPIDVDHTQPVTVDLSDTEWVIPDACQTTVQTVHIAQFRQRHFQCTCHKKHEKYGDAFASVVLACTPQGFMDNNAAREVVSDLNKHYINEGPPQPTKKSKGKVLAKAKIIGGRRFFF